MKPADYLEGLDLDGGWHVDSKIVRPENGTGGSFSVGYFVSRSDGKKAYLKALDFSAAFASPDPPRVLQSLTAAYNFERDLLKKCGEKRCDRIVTPLADGSKELPGSFGSLAKVPYIIFELAAGDIRKEVETWQAFDLAWVLRSLHHTAVGLAQLHKIGVAHQDLKPSNVLVFPEVGSKISDLGRASAVDVASEVDSFPIPGDRGYAPPEQWYGWQYSDDFVPRFISDLYLLGSLMFYYFLRCSATQAMTLKIVSIHGSNFTQKGFLSDLPYIQAAFSDVIVELKKTIIGIDAAFSDELIIIAEQLCEPDPRRRGDPMVLQSKKVPYDLQPYISKFDRLAYRAELKIK